MSWTCRPHTKGSAGRNPVYAWFANRRLLGPIGHVPPVEYEAICKVAAVNQLALRKLRGIQATLAVLGSRVPPGVRVETRFDTIAPFRHLPGELIVKTQQEIDEAQHLFFLAVCELPLE